MCVCVSGFFFLSISAWKMSELIKHVAEFCPAKQFLGKPRARADCHRTLYRSVQALQVEKHFYKFISHDRWQKQVGCFPNNPTFCWLARCPPRTRHRLGVEGGGLPGRGMWPAVPYLEVSVTYLHVGWETRAKINFTRSATVLSNADTRHWTTRHTSRDGDEEKSEINFLRISEQDLVWIYFPVTFFNFLFFFFYVKYEWIMCVEKNLWTLHSNDLQITIQSLYRFRRIKLRIKENWLNVSYCVANRLFIWLFNYVIAFLIVSW